MKYLKSLIYLDILKTYRQTGRSQKGPFQPESQIQVLGCSLQSPLTQPMLFKHSVQFEPVQPSKQLFK